MVSSANARVTGYRREQRTSKRSRFSKLEWQEGTRCILRHLDDPISLQGSVFYRLPAVEELGKARYSENTIPRGLALREVALDSLREIENELDGCAGVTKLKAFVALTRQGMGVAKASRALGITPEYGCRALKRTLVELLAEKLLIRLHSSVT